jgi:hypothetical protein
MEPNTAASCLSKEREIMNAVAKQKMDWSKRSAHQWLEQYGL